MSEETARDPERPSATLHRIGNPYNPPPTAIISVARQLQQYLLDVGAIAEGAPLPFPALHTSTHKG